MYRIMKNSLYSHRNIYIYIYIYIYTDNVPTCILFLFCKSKSQKQLSTFTEESKNKLSSNHFQGCLQSCSTWLNVECSTWLRYHKSHINFMSKYHWSLFYLFITSKYHWSLFYLFITSISKSIGGKIARIIILLQNTFDR